MSDPQTVVTDLAEMTRRGPAAAADVLQAWTSTVAAIGDASGTQASSLRRLTRARVRRTGAAPSCASSRRSSRRTPASRPRRSTRSGS